MAKFVRGKTVHPDLVKECEKLKSQIIRDHPTIDPRLLTFPKLQKLLLEERAIIFRRIPLARINKVLMGM